MMSTFVCPYCDAITFSFTLMLRKSRSVWNVRATPRFVILCGCETDETLAAEQDLALVRP